MEMFQSNFNKHRLPFWLSEDCHAHICIILDCHSPTKLLSLPGLAAARTY